MYIGWQILELLAAEYPKQAGRGNIATQQECNFYIPLIYQENDGSNDEQGSCHRNIAEFSELRDGKQGSYRNN